MFFITPKKQIQQFILDREFIRGTNVLEETIFLNIIKSVDYTLLVVNYAEEIYVQCQLIDSARCTKFVSLISAFKVISSFYGRSKNFLLFP